MKIIAIREVSNDTNIMRLSVFVGLFQIPRLKLLLSTESFGKSFIYKDTTFVIMINSVDLKRCESIFG